MSHKNPTKSPPRTPRRRRNSDASTASPHSSVLGKRPAAAAIHGRATQKRASGERTRRGPRGRGAPAWTGS
ncbi:hypothetical protein Tdes44962_MAKER08301 [Teratosphaeria destructans]|uniref:Uncharacterized protein n=1 Tax=Teratosphaeria destructans TaxID=418781 RepID=A0A9W7W566_9PEZI|nr:hypothetical protein Tdes44962_MAKER08301 [Teratosphaeria destructans]